MKGENMKGMKTRNAELSHPAIGKRMNSGDVRYDVRGSTPRIPLVLKIHICLCCDNRDTESP